MHQMVLGAVVVVGGLVAYLIWTWARAVRCARGGCTAPATMFDVDRLRWVCQPHHPNGKKEAVKYKTVADLAEAYKSGVIPADVPLMLDNDTASVYISTGPEDDPYADAEHVFEMHPDRIMYQALELLGIPVDHV